MRIRSRIAGALVVGALAAALNVVGGGVASAADENDCAIQTSGGYYVEAAGGGGRSTNVMYTDQRGFGSFERFRRVYTGDPRGLWALQTPDGRHYVTAVGSGGLTGADTPDVLHTDATRIGSWEKFNLTFRSDGSNLTIQTYDGHYLGARLGGGVSSYAFNSNATRVGSWETFRLECFV